MKTRKIFLAAIAAFALAATQTQQASAGERAFPVPPTISERAAALVGSAGSPMWLKEPESEEAMRAMARSDDEESAKSAAELAKALGVKIKEGKIAGVAVRTLTPRTIDEDKKDKIIYAIHGGGYVIGGGMAGTTEGLLMAAFNNYKVIAVDYRLAPEHKYPAAIDDAFAVYKELAKEYGAENIAVLGTSTGGAMTLILALQCIAGGAPLPAALVSGTPWSDIGKVGDSYFTNDRVDNVLITYDGLLKAWAEAYAGGADFKDPLLSPVYAKEEDLAKFPPTMLISGTRDLFLSNTVRMHTRLLLAGAAAELVVHEALSHAQYYFASDAPETADHYKMIDMFLDRYLLKTEK